MAVTYTLYSGENGALTSYTRPRRWVRLWAAYRWFVRRTAWWGWLSSGAAPLLLVGGWTVAAGRQPGGFDQVTQTISALAGRAAEDRWVMTGALIAVGLCHVLTAWALRPAATPGRLVLAGGGVATVLVGLLPLPGDGTGSTPHALAATASLTMLGAWPFFARRQGPAPRLLHPAVCLGATVLLLAVLGWFFVEVLTDGGRQGLSERVAAGLQALWPLVVVVGTRTSLGRH